jgi:hypothetical protein
MASLITITLNPSFPQQSFQRFLFLLQTSTPWPLPDYPSIFCCFISAAVNVASGSVTDLLLSSQLSPTWKAAVSLINIYPSVHNSEVVDPKSLRPMYIPRGIKHFPSFPPVLIVITVHWILIKQLSLGWRPQRLRTSWLGAEIGLFICTPWLNIDHRYEH